jgi:hypothetical protein
LIQVQKQALWSTICPKVGLDNTPQNHAIVATNYSTFLLALENMVIGVVKRKDSVVTAPSPAPTVGTPTGRPMTPQIPQTMQQQALGSTIDSELAHSIKNAMQNNQAPGTSPNATNNSMVSMQLINQHVQQQVFQNSMNQQAQQHALQNVMQQQAQQIQVQQMQAQQLQAQQLQAQMKMQIRPTMQPQIQMNPALKQPVMNMSQSMMQSGIRPTIQGSVNPQDIISDTYHTAGIAPVPVKKEKPPPVDPLAGLEIKDEPALKPELTEEEKDLYFTRTRKVTSFGGVDLLALGPALQRMRASKEQYGLFD